MNSSRHTGNDVHCAFWVLGHVCEVECVSSFECLVRRDKAASNYCQLRDVCTPLVLYFVDEDMGFRSFWCWVLFLAFNPSHSVLFMKYSILRLCEVSNETPNKLGQICFQLHKWKQRSPMHDLEFGPYKCSLLWVIIFSCTNFTYLISSFYGLQV